MEPPVADPGTDASTVDDVAQPDVAQPSDASTDAPLDVADAQGDADSGAPFVFVHRDINHVLGTGQSLSVGSQGTPFLTTTQPYDNITFVTGVLSGGTGLTSFIPLVEGDGAGVETLSSSFANLITKLAREVVFVGGPAGKNGHDLLVSAHGVGGTAYVGLKKGTAPFTNGMAQVTAGKTLAAAAGKSYVVRAVTNVHGESDHVAKNAAYQANLLEWQKDYETDVRAMTGQAEPIPMFETQISSWTRYNTTTSAIPMQQLGAHVAAPGKVILVGAKYHLEYVTDGVHLTASGYRHMGEYYAIPARGARGQDVGARPTQDDHARRRGHHSEDARTGAAARHGHHARVGPGQLRLRVRRRLGRSSPGDQQRRDHRPRHRGDHARGGPDRREQAPSLRVDGNARRSGRCNDGPARQPPRLGRHAFA